MVGYVDVGVYSCDIGPNTYRGPRNIMLTYC